MEFSKKDMKILKGVAILFMLALHLFARKEVNGLYETYPTLNGIPLVYYLGLFGDACVPIYLFAGGYGLFYSIGKSSGSTLKKNLIRILKLMINFWIILFLFIFIAHIVGKEEVFSGGFDRFILNFFLVSNSYNGAWWYLQTYVILVFLSPTLIKVVQKYNSIFLVFISGCLYFITYLQRIKNVIDFGDNMALILFINAVVLVGTSQLAFIVGLVFAKEKIYSKIYKRFHHIPYKNVFCIIGILMLIIIHGFIETMFIAPFTAFAFICFFNLMNKGNYVQRSLIFISNHSTNLWLTHMFFYMSIFPGVIFALEYPFLIFIWLIILCLIASYGINAIYFPIVKFVDSKVKNSSEEYNFHNEDAQKVKGGI